ncbi:DEAD/DEAH box helicase [Desulfolutivibrio sulfoxidireducens]|nr:DEAD/DEAH box helicase [Desulfolutivibrio sulfoxidireducens]
MFPNLENRTPRPSRTCPPGPFGQDSRPHMETRDIAEYVRALCASEALGSFVAHHRLIPGAPARTAATLRPWPAALTELLAARGIGELYSHQAKACDLIRSGRHVAVATPTASGKSLVYLLPVLEQFLRDPESRAVFLFPLKALAQDQLRVIHEFLAPLPASARPTAAIFDGDTSAHFRRKIRENPPNILLTNPEMLHLALLPHHENWSVFFAGLTHVVVDEMHTYRGVMGSHMAHVFRRLARVCGRYGARPVFVFCSATIGNPGELARDLTGLDVPAITESGAPTGTRHFIFLNPPGSASTAAVHLLRAALHRELRTIVYTQSRKMTELIAMWLSEKAGKDGVNASRVSAYRSGFLPEERREIEARMTSGELLAVISTSALELGIDIGGLDLCVLAGYPGSVMSTWQRGGRVGRSGRESAVALLAGEDALDQYFMRNPADFFDRPPESAVINPANPAIAARHLECAASELPLRSGEPYLADPDMAAQRDRLVQKGLLLADEHGTTWYAARKRPHRDVNLRGAGGRFRIEAAGQTLGEIDEHRAYRETHPGAVYLHRGRTFEIENLDIPGRTVTAQARNVDYYTKARGNKSTEILEITGQAAAHGARVFRGRLRVTECITGYERRRVRGGTLLGIVPLDLPPLTFETDGFWFAIPRDVQEEMDRRLFHFMGAIHAMEHALIGILPLLVLTDRNDLGGISTPLHEQVGRAAVFVYDGIPGGMGLTRMAFARADEALSRTLAVIASCPCETGCPSCVHSPKCGSGNRPIDKAAARYLLELLTSRDPEPGPVPAAPKQAAAPSVTQSEPLMARDDVPHPASVRIRVGQPAAPTPSVPSAPAAAASPTVSGQDAATPRRYGVLDVETRRSAEEVGGWGNARRMGVSVAVLYDSGLDDFLSYRQEELPEMAKALSVLDLVVGFNIKRFDYQVLGGVCDFPFRGLPTLDLLEKVHERLGYRLSLDGLASATLAAKKTASGLQALAWWKEGRLDLIEEYCRKDVALTRDLYLFGREHRFLLFTNKAAKTVRLPISW